MKLRIENVRLAYPSLFEPNVDAKTGRKMYGCKLILPQDHPQIAQIKAAILEVGKEAWKDQAEVVLKGLKAQDKLCLHDGDTKATSDGFAGNLFVSANSKTRPTVVDANKSPLNEGDGKPYSGCYVNAIVDVWAQDHKEYGKRVNASLMGVQFAADGEAFGGGAVASLDDFDSLSSGSDATDFL